MLLCDHTGRLAFFVELRCETLGGGWTLLVSPLPPLPLLLCSDTAEIPPPKSLQAFCTHNVCLF